MLLHAIALPLSLLLAGMSSSSAQPASSGAWLWPVRGPVINAFDPPDSPFGAGHRGIDIAVPVGTTIVAPQSGSVTFAGRAGGHLFITIDHGGELSSTCSWLSTISVRRGDSVARGQPIGATGVGHPGSVVPHLHFGVRLAGTYLDPLTLLGPPSVVDLIRLAPLAA